MINRAKHIVLVLLCAVLLLLAGCGEAAEPVSPPEPTPVSTPTPTPEPELPTGDAVTVEGTELASGSLVDDDMLYVKLPELTGALGLALEAGEEGAFSFQWDGESVSGRAGSPVLYIRDGAVALTAPMISYKGEIYVPVVPFCELLNIGLYFDEEYSHLYCTVAAGDWALPEGYEVPVLMYHGVSASPWGVTELFVDPSRMEEQLVWLLENDYDPIWFEDLAHVDEYDKPIILTFDDGYSDNYTELFPLLKKYNVKATVFIITGWLDGSTYLSEEQVKEMSRSGLVSIQSHTVSHKDLDKCSEEENIYQMEQSKLMITRLTGKEPVALCYPRGLASGLTLELLPAYYSFGVKMNGRTYRTGDDASLVYRNYVSRSMVISGFAQMLEG